MASLEDLKPQQAAALAQSLAKQGQYLTRLCWRMERLRWPQDDPLYARSLRARDAVMAVLEATQQVQAENSKPASQRAIGR